MKSKWVYYWVKSTCPYCDGKHLEARIVCPKVRAP